MGKSHTVKVAKPLVHTVGDEPSYLVCFTVSTVQITPDRRSQHLFIFSATLFPSHKWLDRIVQHRLVKV